MNCYRNSFPFIPRPIIHLLICFGLSQRTTGSSKNWNEYSTPIPKKQNHVRRSPVLHYPSTLIHLTYNIFQSFERSLIGIYGHKSVLTYAYVPFPEPTSTTVKLISFMPSGRSAMGDEIEKADPWENQESQQFASLRHSRIVCPVVFISRKSRFLLISGRRLWQTLITELSRSSLETIREMWGMGGWRRRKKKWAEL